MQSCAPCLSALCSLSLQRGLIGGGSVSLAPVAAVELRQALAEPCARSTDQGACTFSDEPDRFKAPQKIEGMTAGQGAGRGHRVVVKEQRVSVGDGVLNGQIYQRTGCASPVLEGHSLPHRAPVSSVASHRPRVSVAEPAVYGTTSVMGLVG